MRVESRWLRECVKGGVYDFTFYALYTHFRDNDCRDLIFDFTRRKNLLPREESKIVEGRGLKVEGTYLYSKM